MLALAICSDPSSTCSAGSFPRRFLGPVAVSTAAAGRGPACAAGSEQSGCAGRRPSVCPISFLSLFLSLPRSFCRPPSLPPSLPLSLPLTLSLYLALSLLCLFLSPAPLSGPTFVELLSLGKVYISFVMVSMFYVASPPPHLHLCCRVLFLLQHPRSEH